MKRTLTGMAKRHGEGLWKAARVAINDVLGVKKDETVLIVTNPQKDVLDISMALYDASVMAKGSPSLIVQETKSQLDFAEPSVVNSLSSEPDCMISISLEKLGKDRIRMKSPIKVGKKKYDHIFNYLLGEGKSRAFWSPSITKKMFIKTVPVNYPQMRMLCKKISKVLTKATEVRITTKKGMDLRIGLKGRKALADDGDFRKPGRGGNLPCGEVFISPALGKSNGIIAFDGSIASDKGVIKIKKPIMVDVKDGFVKRVYGGSDANKLQGTLQRAIRQIGAFQREGKITKKIADEYRKNVYNLGELGIGLNNKASIVGNILEDEKVFRTCHIAIGANYDDDANTIIHLDGLIQRPTMTASIGTKEQMIMSNGNLLVK